MIVGTIARNKVASVTYVEAQDTVVDKDTLIVQCCPGRLRQVITMLVWLWVLKVTLYQRNMQIQLKYILQVWMMYDNQYLLFF